MEVKIKYSELQDFILQNFKKEVALTFDDQSPVSLCNPSFLFRNLQLIYDILLYIDYNIKHSLSRASLPDDKEKDAV